VLLVRAGKFSKSYNSFYDLFRVENGKIAEHWTLVSRYRQRKAGKISMVNSVSGVGLSRQENTAPEKFDFPAALKLKIELAGNIRIVPRLLFFS
jgi:hypothetical protein